MPNQGYAAGNIVDFIRGFGQRKEAAEVKDAQKNFLADPEAAIKDVYAIDPNAGEALRDKAVQNTQVAFKDTQNQQKAHLGAIRNVATMLGGIKDPTELASKYDTLTPVFKSALGMTDDEIADYKGRIVQDPGILDNLRKDADSKLMNLAAGASAVDPQTGAEIFHNAGALKSVIMKDANGNTHAAVFDPETGTYSSGAPGSAGVPAGQPAPASGGVPLTLATALPHFVAQESGGNYAAVNPTSGALGKYQIMPETGAALARKAGAMWRPDLMQSDTPEGRKYQDALGPRAVQEAIDFGGGDPVKTASYYYGGPDQSKWGPKTKQYANDMVSRFSGGAPAASNGTSATGSAFGLETSAVKPTKGGWTIATPEQKAAAGVDAATPYQVSPEGKLEKVGERASTAKAVSLGSAQPSQVQDYRKSIIQMQGQAQRLLDSPALDSAVGPVQGRIAGYTSKEAADWQNDIQSLRDRVALGTLAKMKQLSKTGASGLGSLTEKEGTRLENQLGSLSITGGEDGIRRTLREVISWTDDQLSSLPDTSRVPAAAVQYLKAHPNTKDQFDAQFGAGMSLLVGGK